MCRGCRECGYRRVSRGWGLGVEGRRSLKNHSLGVIITHKHKHDYVCNHRCNYNYTHTIVQGVQGVCRECRKSAGGVQGVQGVCRPQRMACSRQCREECRRCRLPYTPCTTGSIISGAGECRECRHTSEGGRTSEGQ